MKINEIINEAIKPYLSMTDYDLRAELVGCGFMAAIYSRQFHEVGTEEYSKLCIGLTNKLSDLYHKAKCECKEYKIDITYKSKNGSTSFGYECTTTERTEEEARQRILARKFKDLNTGRTIKPVFTKFEISI